MTVLAGADLVLPDRVVAGGSLVIEGDRIVAIERTAVRGRASEDHVNLAGCFVVPGFVDVHVHGVEGHDVLDGVNGVEAVAERLPAFGVTAFCPTSIACAPAALGMLLQAVGQARRGPGRGARVLPAHLESNFINPDFTGAQPLGCVRQIPSSAASAHEPPGPRGAWTGHEILATIAAHRADVGIVTLAPELPGGFDLVRRLAADGHIVSIGHSGASYEEAHEAVAAGVSHATHLFNRMTPMTHRAPGVPGAVLESPRVIAELICDGYHVHPALLTVAIRAKGMDGIMAITDGTAGAGLPVGSTTHLGGRPITVTPRAAVLEDGTLAGSVLTMDRAFRMLVQRLHLSVVEAARLCSTTPARQLRLQDTGHIAPGAVADLVVLDRQLTVRHTYLRGVPWRNPAPRPLV